MLTGDENIVDVDFVVYWRISDASAYLFNIQNPTTTVKEVAESAMREIVGQSKIAPLLTEARQKTEAAAQKLIQSTLDSYKAGIQIDQVQLQKVDPPSQVIDAFRDVQAARADQERLQNEAYAYANRIVPEARGDAQRILQAAEGYKQQTVAEATGQAARFLKVYEEYKKAPEVTRQRLFLETMERVLGGHRQDHHRQQGGQGVVPYLPLEQLQRPKAHHPGEQLSMLRYFFGSLLVAARGRSRGASTGRCSSCTRTSRRWFWNSASSKRNDHQAGPALEDPDRGERRLFRQAHPRPGYPTAGGDRVRPEAPGGRRLRALSDHRSAALLPDGARRADGQVAAGPDRRIRPCVAFWAPRRSRTWCATNVSSSMKLIATQVNDEGKEFGLEVVDVRIKRADLPEQNSKNIYDRMRAERQREASEFRAEGAAAANRIRATADREATVIKADATNQSEQLRGAGDADRNRIFAEAYGRDPDFFAFYRSMQAYEAGIKPGDTRMLLSPDSEFFRYFNKPSGGPAPTTPSGTAPGSQPKR